MEKIIRGDLLISFERWLCSEEKSRGTVEKYCGTSGGFSDGWRAERSAAKRGPAGRNSF